MSKAQLILKYKENVQLLRQSAKDRNISEKDIDNLFEDCFCVLKYNNVHNLKLSTNNNTITSILLFLIKLLCIFVIVLSITLVIFYNHQPTLSLILRNVQNFIYPGLKVLRLFAIPVIKVFPSLSEFYDETCLIENPYFQVTNMECWPCENVHSIVNLTASKAQNIHQSEIPYVIKTLNEDITLSVIQNLYRNNSDIFDVDANRLTSTNPVFSRAQDLLRFSSSNNSDTHIVWRVNRMAPARALRTIFPKAAVVSSAAAWSGQSTERYLMVDGAQARPYVLPNPECSSVLLTQGCGERTIVLKPSKECSRSCRPVSVVLKPSYSLWYNWWYWKPISLPIDKKSSVSISYLTSYC